MNILSLNDLKEMSGLQRLVKKIKLPDGGLLIFQTDKMIVKTAGCDEHITIWFSKDGLLDVHKMLEGKSGRILLSISLTLRNYDRKIFIAYSYYPVDC